MELPVRSGQSIYDLAIATGYTIDNVYALISGNPFVTSINYDFDANPGKIIEYDPTFKIASAPQLTQSVPASASTTVLYRPFDQQNIFDLLIQTYGTLDLIYKFIQDNSIANINEQSFTGRIMNFDILAISDLGLYNQLSRSGQKIATGTISEAVVGRYRVIQDGTPRVIQTGDLRTIN